ncbi:kinase-like domain-containing protein [Emericellopsis atlantica]|uniref:Kinase-like domain-containing protein n=1 Tax=Emericellopsis atlantica TaxID=2614577 RepID=A0A9P8CSC8_9HYPO|nr:kinase-like domain-containing protein [Emericellopsis atlantica]KAG9257070.1 kinase-like domain-containing protein [Emericellopsis atlantica]
MSTASPTPAPAGVVRRTSQRQASLRRPPSRLSNAKNSALPVPATAPEAPAVAQQLGQQQQYDNDSSEDEIPVPMKLSALTKALLSDGAPMQQQHAALPSPPRTRRQTSTLSSSTSSAREGRRHLRSSSVQAAEPKDEKPSSPIREQEKEPSQPRKRVVRLSHTPQSLGQVGPSKRRSTSNTRSNARSLPHSRSESRSGHRDESADEKRDYHNVDINTPGQPERVVRIVTGSSGKRSRLSSSGQYSGRQHDRSMAEKSTMDGDHADEDDPDDVARNAPPVSVGGMINPQGSMRVKRIGKTPGSFLSGPARRGRRRQSEEDENGDGEHALHDPEASAMRGEDLMASSFYGAESMRDFNSGSPVSGNAASRASHRRQVSNADLRGSVRRSSALRELAHEPNGEIVIPQSRQRPTVPSANDQENAGLASSKPPKPLDLLPVQPLNVEAGVAKTSPDRKPLGPVERNTPRRSAPAPPPKMSVLEAATSNAGASTTTQAKQRRNVLKVNGKCYTRLDCLGRGGSAKVYRVTAENGKMFALKRVALENADEATIRGFRGEIDLLGKLSNVDRVINLFDHELNSEKQVLTLLMEMGELDLNTLLRSRQNPENAKFDPVFVRFYWKEMLECLQAVHQCDIVHSDLKPANFVLVQGRLKLIDFGIANAIQTDQTVNVHRENQIGTPNYMSPESLLDSNNPRGGRVPGRPKLMKIGKPSDVWSLGCILYQMVYGLPPFGHIANSMSRCQAIINWDHAIEYPSRGMGGAPVPPSLIRTMKRCLYREQHMRPTCAELLNESDPFLYPAELSDKATPIDEELLARIIHSVVNRCKERMPTDAEVASAWPQAYWASVRKATAGRM